MSESIWAVLLTSAEGSFIQVTVFVGAVLLLFGYIDYTQQGALVATIERSKKYQPLIGALLGIIPGCGGSILLMPLYIKGTVTFGTVVATLIATAGDSAFVVLTQAPKDFLVVTFICLIVGTLVGYLVDYLKIGDWVQKRAPRKKISDVAALHAAAEAALDQVYCDEPGACRSSSLRHIGHEEGDEIDLILHHSQPLNVKGLGYRITHNAYTVFWGIIALGFVLGILDLMQIDINRLPVLKNFGYYIGVLGTLMIVLFMIFSRKLIRAQTHEDAEHKLFRLKETFIHNAQETAFVGTWVFAAYFVYELAVSFAGGPEVVAALLSSTGLTAVLVGVLVGVIPGCGPQVIFVSLYLKGMFPFAALLANAISQDGDALFPLIAMDGKSAFWATVVNTIAALAVGIMVYYLLGQ